MRELSQRLMNERKIKGEIKDEVTKEEKKGEITKVAESIESPRFN